MITQIDHIGIAVTSLQENIPFYRDILKLQYLGTERVPEQRVLVAMFQAGEVKIELLEPTAPDSPIARFIEKRGEGIHHIAYRTDDIEETVATMAAKGIDMIDEKPRPGAHGTRIAFIHPGSSKKILSELCEIKGEQA